MLSSSSAATALVPKLKRIPTQLFIGAYQGEHVARSLEQLVTDEEFDSAGIICTNMAVASCDVAGKIQIRELGNPAAMEQAVESAMLGGLLGSMSRLMIGDDATIARAAQQINDQEEKAIASALEEGKDKEETASTKSNDTKKTKPFRRTSALIKAATKQIAPGMNKDKLTALGNALKPGTSAIVLIFDEVLVKQEDYDNKMKEHQKGTDAIAEVVTSKIQQHLEQGHDIAFHLTFHENGDVDVTRTVQGEVAVQIRDIVLGSDSLTVDQVTSNEKGSVVTDQLVVTPEAVATARTMLTSSLVAYEVSLEDEDGFVYAKGASHEKSTENSYEMIETSEMGVFTENTSMYQEETVSVSVKVETTKALEE